MDILKAIKVLYLTVITIATVNGQSYRAGVVLFEPNSSKFITPDEKITNNLNLSVQIMDAYKNETDIFVLPEYALTNINLEFDSKRKLEYFRTNIGKVGDNLCITNGSTISELNLAILACAAKNNYYIVANFIEEDNNTFFSTDVVIDPNGVLCLKCRKYHIVKGTNFEKSSDPKPCKFTATFRNQSVEFLLLYGTDLVYGIPDELKADNVIITAATKNNLPLNMSVSLSQGFAISNGVNLIVAEYNNITGNYGGSGIFYGNGTSVIAFNASNVPKGNNMGGVLMKEIPIKSSSSSIINVKSTMFGQTPQMDLEYINLPPAFNSTDLEGKHCIDKRCCTFKAELSANSVSPYQWIVLQNKTNILNQEADIFFCGLIISSASYSKLIFKNITISVDDKQSDVLQTLPIALNENFLPTNFQFNKISHTITFDKENNVVVLFGIMEILSTPISSTNTAFIVIIVLLILALIGLMIAFLIWRKRQAKNRRNF